MSQTVLVFPGQGAFYAGALHDTHHHYPAVAWVFERVEAVAQRRLGRSLIRAMWHEPQPIEHWLRVDPDLLQLAIYTISVATYELLRTEGVKADLLLGHSFGEIAALTCAGVYSVELGAQIVCDRVESLALAAPGDGCMAALAANPEQVRGLLADFAHGRPVLAPAAALAIAVENHGGQTVVSGARVEMDAFIELCRGQRYSAQRLHSSYAFHHPGLQRASELFAARLAAYPTAPPRLPVYSPILGRYYRDDDRFGELLARHLVEPVQFSAAVRFVHGTGIKVCIECGALNALSKIVIRVLGPGQLKVFATLEQQTDELNNIRKITHHADQGTTMNAPIINAPRPTDASIPEFEAFWNERSPILLAQIKSEFLRFFETQAGRSPAPAAAPLPVSPPAMAAQAPRALPRSQLFVELIAIYAEAMEYPTEVFSEVVELEAELGIDSVKQMEIIGRISTQYALPPLPANFRSGDFKTMGQIVDFVFAHQGHAGIAA